MARPSEPFVAQLTTLLEEARQVVSADYAALGILDAERIQLEHFLTVGVDDATREAIGVQPRGRGVLGVLIEDPKPLRLHDVTQHERSYGFPRGHPEMHSFLGVPVLVAGVPQGNMYFTQKRAGSFDHGDESLALAYASRMGTLIDAQQHLNP